jgi:hypothetical protein
MAESYPWYEVVEGEKLEQGDLLRACPVVVPALPNGLIEPDVMISAEVLTYDVLVMTQSCDLANNKTTEVILCPHWDLKAAGQIDPLLAFKNSQRAILKGQHYRYTMLAASLETDPSVGIHIVDFGRIFSLPKSFVQQFAAQQGRRLRLLPPYREHLSQSFARFFMRVGLPQDIELP